MGKNKKGGNNKNPADKPIVDEANVVKKAEPSKE